MAYRIESARLSRRSGRVMQTFAVLSLGLQGKFELIERLGEAASFEALSPGEQAIILAGERELENPNWRAAARERLIALWRQQDAEAEQAARASTPQ